MPDENRVFDVARPGHSSPDATSKPIIVGHRPTLSDPMVKDTDPSDFGAESSPTQIMVHDDAHNPSPAHDTNAPGIIDTPEEDWKQPEIHEPLATPQETPAGPIPSPEEQPYDAPAEPDAPAPGGDPPTDDSPAVPADSYEALPSEPLAHVEGLHVSEPKRKSPLKMILLVILLLLVAAYLAIDSGLIKTSLNLPFHIFKQKTNTPAAVTTPPAQNQATATAAVPTGFTEYKLAGTTITFAAPTAWGQPTSETEAGYSSRSATPTTSGTYAYLVTFATNKDIQVAVTSAKLLPAARGALFYDYLQWCTGTSDAKIYLSVLHFATANKVDTPTTVACDQGPLNDATKLDTSTIVELNAKDAGGAALGDIYTKNLTSTDLPVFRVKDHAMASSVDIKKLLLTVKE